MMQPVPFKSQAQRRKFAQLLLEGKMLSGVIGIVEIDGAD